MAPENAQEAVFRVRWRGWHEPSKQIASFAKFFVTKAAADAFVASFVAPVITEEARSRHAPGS